MSMTSIFNTSREYTRMHAGANLVILAQIFDDLSHGQSKFPKKF